MLQREDSHLRERETLARLHGPVGVVRNPKSRRNRREGVSAGWRELDHPDLIQAELGPPGTLVEALKGFARREVGLIIVDGGDGTVQEVLTALRPAYGDNPPALALLASGTTNLIAADVGSVRAAPAAVAQLMGLTRPGASARISRRHALEVRWPDGSHPTVAGMLLGAAAFTRGTELSEGLMRRGPVDEGAGVAVTLASAMAQLVGPARSRWLRGEPLGLSIDGGPEREGDRFIFLATSLRRLMLGLWPFWGEGEGELRYLDVDANPRRLLRALPGALRGRPRPWFSETGYRSGSAHRLGLSIRTPFVLDGEYFEPGPAGRVEVVAGQSLDFISP